MGAAAAEAAAAHPEMDSAAAAAWREQNDARYAAGVAADEAAEQAAGVEGGHQASARGRLVPYAAAVARWLLRLVGWQRG